MQPTQAPTIPGGNPVDVYRLPDDKHPVKGSRQQDSVDEAGDLSQVAKKAQAL
jgi:hypothetical protein